MKRRYQTDREKAVRRFQEKADQGDREIQLHLPLKQIAAALQEGVGTLMRQAGLGHCQVNGARAVFALKIVRGFSPSAGTARRLPVGESSLPEESLMDRFEVMPSYSEQVLNRAVDREKSLNLCRRLEATHLAFLLPGVLVRDFRSVIFVLPSSVGDGWEDLSVRGRIASELVGDELPGRPLLVFQNLTKEALSGSLVSVACDQDIEDVAILVHCSPKIMTFAADRDEHLVHVPDVSEATLSPPQRAGIRWSKLAAPGSNGFVGYGDATLREKVLHVAEAQREPMVQPDGMADDLGRKAVASIQ